MATGDATERKNKNRSSITNGHLEQRMRLATTSLEANVHFLPQQKQTSSGSLNWLILIGISEINLQ